MIDFIAENIANRYSSILLRRKFDAHNYFLMGRIRENIHENISMGDSLHFGKITDAELQIQLLAKISAEVFQNCIGSSFFYPHGPRTLIGICPPGKPVSGAV